MYLAPCKPWYERGADEAAPALGRGGRVLEEEAAARQRGREERDKARADPVAVFLPAAAKSGLGARAGGKGSRWGPGPVPPMPPVARAADGGQCQSKSMEVASSSSSSSSSDSSDSSEGGRRRRKRSKRRKSKSEKKEVQKKKKKGDAASHHKRSSGSKRCSAHSGGSSKEKEKEGGHRRRRTSSSSRQAGSESSSGHPPAAAAAGSGGGGGGPPSVEALRQRRLAREQEEHRRAVRLLAERQLAGLSYPGGATPLLEAEREPEVEMDDRRRDYNSRFFGERGRGLGRRLR